MSPATLARILVARITAFVSGSATTLGTVFAVKSDTVLYPGLAQLSREVKTTPAMSTVTDASGRRRPPRGLAPRRRRGCSRLGSSNGGVPLLVDRPVTVTWRNAPELRDRNRTVTR